MAVCSQGEAVAGAAFDVGHLDVDTVAGAAQHDIVVGAGGLGAEGGFVGGEVLGIATHAADLEVGDAVLQIDRALTHGPGPLIGVQMAIDDQIDAMTFVDG